MQQVRRAVNEFNAIPGKYHNILILLLPLCYKMT